VFLLLILSKKSEEQNRVKCNCGVLLEYTGEDIENGAFGCPCIECPKCKGKIYIEDERYDKNITIDNISYPQDFFNSKNGVDIDDQEINKWIHECLVSLRGSKEDYGVFATAGSGNTMVFVVKYEDEYSVYVSKKYYECSIER
jgi:hypothetical protein